MASCHSSISSNCFTTFQNLYINLFKNVFQTEHTTFVPVLHSFLSFISQDKEIMIHSPNPGLTVDSIPSLHSPKGVRVKFHAGAHLTSWLGRMTPVRHTAELSGPLTASQCVLARGWDKAGERGCHRSDPLSPCGSLWTDYILCTRLDPWGTLPTQASLRVLEMVPSCSPGS